jgi:hypothetical protein
MPVTTRLVQRLNDVLGEEATDDLFAWWQETARVNRAEIREVADLYFARFEARLEKGLAEVRAEMASLKSEMNSGMAARLAEVRSEMATQGADLRSEMAAQRADLVKWMFIFWAGTVIPLAGLAIALSRL